MNYRNQRFYRMLSDENCIQVNCNYEIAQLNSMCEAKKLKQAIDKLRE